MSQIIDSKLFHMIYFSFKNQMGDSNISSPGLQPSTQLSNLGSTETLEEMPSGSQDKVCIAKALALSKITKHRVTFCKDFNAVQVCFVINLSRYLQTTT